MGPRLSRRGMMGGGLGLIGLGGLSGLGTQLVAASSASAAVATDYRALVCVYLNGGLDHLNTLIPYDSSNYNALRGYRSNVLPDRTRLSPLAPKSSQGGRQVALHPALPNLSALFASGELALLTGIGHLEQPVSRAGLTAGTDRLPMATGSHNDGGSFVHNLGPEGTPYGWGGRTLDILSSLNPDPLLSSINIGLSCSFGSGFKTQTITYGDIAGIPGTSGTLFGSTTAAEEVRKMLERTDIANSLGSDYAAVNQLVLKANAQIRQIQQSSANVAPLPADTGQPNYQTGWRDNSLAHDLRTVLQIISQQSVTGLKRQIFFVSLLGFDTHGGTVENLDQRLYIRLDNAFSYFFKSLQSMGLERNVTLFTTSEFGRSLLGNASQGTDHGWGGVSFVMGGGVKGGDIYGSLVDIDPKGPGFDPSQNGQLAIPTMSWDQYGATFARWLGVANGSIPDIFPNIGRFASRDLGFLS